MVAPISLSRINIQAGDYFCVRGHGAIAAGIRAAEWFNSHDNEATYGHCALILNERGTVLDTRWIVGRTNLSLYYGQQILIARPTHRICPKGVWIDDSDKMLALKAIEIRDTGKWYPVHRIPMHLIPWVAKFFSRGRMMVCSERVASYLSEIGARNGPCAGATPDMLADEARRWRNIEVAAEGELQP